MDECSGERYAADCVVDAICVNTAGSFTCTCPPGYSGDGRTSGTQCQGRILGYTVCIHVYHCILYAWTCMCV